MEVYELIKCYIELNEIEKNLVLDFVNRKIDKKKNIDDIDDMFISKIYDFGHGALFYFKLGQVVGKINIVLEVVRELGTAYIHFLDILEDLEYEEMVIKALIDNAISVANEYSANIILLGERDSQRLKTLEKIGFHKHYRSIKMYLEDRDLRESCLSLTPLSQENKLEYLRIYNDSFSDMPHGTVLDINGVREHLEKADNENYYFIVRANDLHIGFLNCTIENNEGFFDIGLCKNYRGKGYGKQLLETAINFLNEKKLQKIYLIVIEKNIIAYNMYKKRDFKEESTLSNWIIIK